MITTCQVLYNCTQFHEINFLTSECTGLHQVLYTDVMASTLMFHGLPERANKCISNFCALSRALSLICICFVQFQCVSFMFFSLFLKSLLCLFYWRQNPDNCPQRRFPRPYSKPLLFLMQWEIFLCNFDKLIQKDEHGAPSLRYWCNGEDCQGFFFPQSSSKTSLYV